MTTLTLEVFLNLSETRNDKSEVHSSMLFGVKHVFRTFDDTIS